MNDTKTTSWADLEPTLNKLDTGQHPIIQEDIYIEQGQPDIPQDIPLTDEEDAQSPTKEATEDKNLTYSIIIIDGVKCVKITKYKDEGEYSTREMTSIRPAELFFETRENIHTVIREDASKFKEETAETKPKK